MLMRFVKLHQLATLLVIFPIRSMFHILRANITPDQPPLVTSRGLRYGSALLNLAPKSTNLHLWFSIRMGAGLILGPTNEEHSIP